MSMAGNGWKGWLLGVVAVLAAYGVQGTVRTAIAQSVAEAKIEDIERRQAAQERAIAGGLEKIDVKLDKIIDAVGDIKTEDAKHHHTHNPR